MDLIESAKHGQAHHMLRMCLYFFMYSHFLKAHPHLATLPEILLDVDACISRNFRTCCWTRAQCGWVSKTVAAILLATDCNIARCGSHFSLRVACSAL